MVVRLSNKRVKTTKNAFLPLKWPFVGQPDNHIGWAISLVYSWVSSTYQRTISWNFGEKMFRIGGFEKLTFFETTKFQYLKYKKIWLFSFIPAEMFYKFLGKIDWVQFLRLLWFPIKRLGGDGLVTNTVQYVITLWQEIWKF